jgi:hypothetical protein
MGTAAFIALLAGAGLWRLASPNPEPQPARDVRPAPVASEAQVPAPPRYQVERVEAPSGAQVEVARVDAERTRLARFAANALVPLTPEEEALLREEEDVEDLGELIARTERHFREARPEEREAKERRYLAAMNLAAKLAPPESPVPDEEAREAQARYLQALEGERARWARLPPDEQRRRQDAFKEAFFRNPGERK